MEILILSFIAGFVCLVIRKKNNILSGVIALLSSAVCLAFSVKLFIYKQIGYPSWFKIDGLNSFLVPFICLFGFLIILYSLGGVTKNIISKNEYYAYLLWTICVSCAAVLANNIILFLLMWGIGAFLLYMLIGIQDPSASSFAAKKTFIMVAGSDAIMILGAAILWKLTGTFDIDKMQVAVTTKAAIVAFLCLAIGALTKAGAMPFHTWIPDSSEVAPIPVMAILPASLDKLLGIYLLARCTVNIFTLDGNSFLSFLLMIIGALTVICAVMMALVQHNFKKLLAYDAVSQVGYMVLGIASATTIGIAGGLFHMLNHAIYKSCLFLTGGCAEYRTGQSELNKMGGLARLMPITFISAVIASLAVSGVPPFNGFFSKWMVYQGLIQRLATGGEGRFTVLLCLVAAMFGSALTLANFMRFLHAVFLGQPTQRISEERPKEVPFHMWFGVSVLSLLCILFGVFANQLPLKYFIYPAVGEVQMIGNYAPVASTGLIIFGIIIGMVIYYIGGIKKTAREDTYFIGGEVMPLENKVSGTEFYANIRELQVLKSIYNKAEAGIFDIYQQGKKLVFFISAVFRYLHNGILTTYLVWMLLGMVGLFFVLLK